MNLKFTLLSLILIFISTVIVSGYYSRRGKSSYAGTLGRRYGEYRYPRPNTYRHGYRRNFRIYPANPYRHNYRRRVTLPNWKRVIPEGCADLYCFSCKDGYELKTSYYPYMKRECVKKEDPICGVGFYPFNYMCNKCAFGCEDCDGYTCSKCKTGYTLLQIYTGYSMCTWAGCPQGYELEFDLHSGEQRCKKIETIVTDRPEETTTTVMPSIPTEKPVSTPTQPPEPTTETFKVCTFGCKECEESYHCTKCKIGYNLTPIYGGINVCHWSGCPEGYQIKFRGDLSCKKIGTIVTEAPEKTTTTTAIPPVPTENVTATTMKPPVPTTNTITTSPTSKTSQVSTSKKVEATTAKATTATAKKVEQTTTTVATVVKTSKPIPNPDGCLDARCVLCKKDYAKYVPVPGVNLCVKKCLAGYTNVTGVCVACSDKRCASCQASILECDRCLKGYAMLLDSTNTSLECVRKCPKNHKLTEHEGVPACIKKASSPCPIEDCKVCTRSNLHILHVGCGECKPGFYLHREAFKDSCLTECPSGYYKDRRPGTDIKACSKCVTPFCKECATVASDAGSINVGAANICTKCVNPFVLDDITLRCNLCPLGTVFDFAEEKCIERGERKKNVVEEFDTLLTNF